jgi:hypothetical protein
MRGMFLIIAMAYDYTFAPSSEKGVIILEMEALAAHLFYRMFLTDNI